MKLNLPKLPSEMSTDEKIQAICEAVRFRCRLYGKHRSAEDVLHLECSLEASVEEYFLSLECDLTDDGTGMGIGDVADAYLADNPEKG